METIAILVCTRIAPQRGPKGISWFGKCGVCSAGCWVCFEKNIECRWIVVVVIFTLLDAFIKPPPRPPDELHSISIVYFTKRQAIAVASAVAAIAPTGTWLTIRALPLEYPRRHRIYCYCGNMAQRVRDILFPKRFVWTVFSLDVKLYIRTLYFTLDGSHNDVMCCVSMPYNVVISVCFVGVSPSLLPVTRHSSPAAQHLAKSSCYTETIQWKRDNWAVFLSVGERNLIKYSFIQLIMRLTKSVVSAPPGWIE